MAQAEPGVPPSAVPAPKPFFAHNYRPLLAIVDMVGAGLILTSIASDSGKTSGATGVLGVLLSSVGGPIIHGAEGTGARGLASLGLRLGGLVGGAVIAAETYEPHPYDDVDSERRAGAHFSRIGTGVLLGALGGVVLDHVILSTRKVPEPGATSARWSPSVAPGKDGMTLGLAGTW